MKFDLKAAVGTIAPTIATMLGGPLAGTAVTALAKAFGLDEAATSADITKVIQSGAMTPEIIAAVRTADQHHAEVLGQQGIDLAKLNADSANAAMANDSADRDSARKREIAVGGRTPATLAGVVTLGFFGILAFMLKNDVPDGSKDVLNIMLGSLGTAWISIISYYFGSTAGSARKTELMVKAK